jgi:hypothetical protein
MLKLCASCLPLNARKHIYNAYGLSYLMYGIECWANTSTDNINRITVLQKKLIRIMFFLSSLTHCAPYAITANILYVNDLIKYKLCILAYRAFYKLCMPCTVAKYYTQPVYRYNTRFVHHNFNVISTRTIKRRFSVIVNSIFLWNQLSTTIRECKSLSMFKLALHNELFSSYA